MSVCLRWYFVLFTLNDNENKAKQQILPQEKEYNNANKKHIRQLYELWSLVSNVFGVPGVE